MRKHTTIILFIVLILISCNKEKKLMKKLVGNWNINNSELAILEDNGEESVIESLTNAGTLVIYENADNPSDESKLYDFQFISSSGDTIQNNGVLVTDEKNKRIILTNALNDSIVHSDLVWTIEKTRKNKQVWSLYGIDSTLYYPSNNNNPGAASNWIVWRITLKKD